MYEAQYECKETCLRCKVHPRAAVGQDGVRYHEKQRPGKLYKGQFKTAYITDAFVWEDHRSLKNGGEQAEQYAAYRISSVQIYSGDDDHSQDG